jgi:hypothetical protein
MKINNNTVFPIFTMIAGVATFIRDGSSGVFTDILPIKLGLWQQPVGALIFLIGFILYKRSAK